MIFCLCTTIFLISLSGIASSAPLFDSDATLDVIIEAPIRKLSGQRHKNPQFAGTFRYTDASGTERTLAIVASTRGRSRLKVCDYPPLRVTFNRDATAGTVFEGQRKLKLVRQCMRRNASRDWVHLELGIYRAYNTITDFSYRVRQISVTYRDTESRGSDQVQPGFFLEADRDVARRLNRRRIRPTKIDPEQLNVVETTHNVLFHYLIGNTDFAVKRGPTGEGCCHNGCVIAEAGNQHDWVVVPYDFDAAGIIDTNYALPHEKLPINRVTTRLYRGFCWQHEELRNSTDLFNKKRVEIETALISPEVTERKSRLVKKYLDQFYEIISDPQALQVCLFDKCRGPESLPLRESLVSSGN